MTQNLSYTITTSIPALTSLPALTIIITSSFENFLHTAAKPQSNLLEVKVSFTSNIITALYSYSRYNRMNDYPSYREGQLAFYHTSNSRYTDETFYSVLRQTAGTRDFLHRRGMSRRNRAERSSLSAILPLLRGLADQKGIWVEFGSSLSHPISITFQDSHDASWFSMRLSPIAGKELLQGFQQRAVKEFAGAALAAPDIL